MTDMEFWEEMNQPIELEMSEGRGRVREVLAIRNLNRAWMRSQDSTPDNRLSRWLNRWAARRTARLMLEGTYDRGMGEGRLGRTLWNVACYINPDDQNGLNL